MFCILKEMRITHIAILHALTLINPIYTDIFWMICISRQHFGGFSLGNAPLTEIHRNAILMIVVRLEYLVLCACACSHSSCHYGFSYQIHKFLFLRC